jgi:hypothetical protein
MERARPPEEGCGLDLQSTPADAEDCSTDAPSDNLDQPSLIVSSSVNIPAFLATCPSAKTMTAYSQTLERGVIMAITCKRWGCSVCGRRRVTALAKKTAASKPNRLVTLTLRPEDWTDPRSAFEKTAPKVNILAREARREWGEWEHLRVLEVTKKGWPHYHLVVRSPFIPLDWVKRHWRRMTGAYIVDMRQIKDSFGVYLYVVKYLAKQAYIPWTDRRVSQTKGFFLPEQFEPREPLHLADKQFSPWHPATYLDGDCQGLKITQLSRDCWFFG